MDIENLIKNHGYKTNDKCCGRCDHSDLTKDFRCWCVYYSNNILVDYNGLCNNYIIDKE